MSKETQIIREVAKQTALSYFNDKEWFSKNLLKSVCKGMVSCFLENYNEKHGTFYSLSSEEINWKDDVYKPFRELGINLIEAA